VNDSADRRILQEDVDDFGAQLETWRIRMENALAARLPESDVVPARLHEAMRYSVLGGGKRIRPALVFATARAVGLSETTSRPQPAPSNWSTCIRWCTMICREWTMTICAVAGHLSQGLR